MKKTIIALLFTTSAYAQDIEIFAHRGFRGLNPENTITAFKDALNYTRTLEMDIMLSKDMQVIVTHDPVINNKLYTDNSGQLLEKNINLKVYELNAQELQQYQLGLIAPKNFQSQKSKAEKIPTREEVILAVKDEADKKGIKEPHYFIETKIKQNTDDINHPNPKITVELLVGVLKKHLKPNQVIIQSFDPRTLSYLEKHYPEYKTCLLDGKKKSIATYLEELDFVPDYFSTNFSNINPELLDESKKFKIPLIGGNTNSKAEVNQMAAWGIKQVISDYPYDYLK